MVAETGLGLVLFRAGAAPWHDDPVLLGKCRPACHPLRCACFRRCICGTSARSSPPAAAWSAAACTAGSSRWPMACRGSACCRRSRARARQAGGVCRKLGTAGAAGQRGSQSARHGGDAGAGGAGRRAAGQRRAAARMLSGEPGAVGRPVAGARSCAIIRGSSPSGSAPCRSHPVPRRPAPDYRSRVAGVCRHVRTAAGSAAVDRPGARGSRRAFRPRHGSARLQPVRAG